MTDDPRLHAPRDRLDPTDDVIDDLIDDGETVGDTGLDVEVPLDTPFEVPVVDAIDQHRTVPASDDAWEHDPPA